MFSNRRERLDSISNCLNNLVNDFTKKKNNQDRKFKLSLTMNSSTLKNQSIDKNKNFNYNNISTERISQKQSFNKNYSKIMKSVSPKGSYETNKNKIKNINLWDLTLKKTSNQDMEKSSKPFDDFKMKLIYNQSKEKIDEQQLFNHKIKRSNSSDFFKTTSNSDNKTFSSSRNSMNPLNLNSNYSSLKADRDLNSINNNERNENVSFNSFKSLSPFKTKKNTQNSDQLEINKTPESIYNSIKGNTITNGSILGKSNRVNFENFNSIGDNPFKINLFDKNSILTNTRKRYSKYGNMKEGYNLSPKNIYPPTNSNIKNSLMKSNIKIEKIFDKSMDKKGKKDNYLHSTSNSLLNKSGNSFNEVMTSRQHTMKKLDNLINNFTEPTKIESFKNRNNNAKGSFLIKNENGRKLFDLIK